MHVFDIVIFIVYFDCIGILDTMNIGGPLLEIHLQTVTLHSQVLIISLQFADLFIIFRFNAARLIHGIVR